MFEVFIGNGAIRQHEVALESIFASVSVNPNATNNTTDPNTNNNGTTLGNPDPNAFTIADGSYSATIPEGWFVEQFSDSNVFLIQTSEDLDPFEPDLFTDSDAAFFVFPTFMDMQAIFDYPGTLDASTQASTIVSYFASTGTADGYVQQGAMDVLTLNNNQASYVIANQGQHSRMVVAFPDGRGDFTTVMLFAQQGTIQENLAFVQTTLAGMRAN